MHQELVEAGKLKAACILNMRLFSGFTPHEAEAITLAAIMEEGMKLGSKMLFGYHIERGLAPRRSVLELMDFVRGLGVEIWVVSATAEPAIRAAMRHFGIEAALIATRIAESDGVFTCELLEPLPMFEGKATCIRKYVDPARSPLLVVGDAPGDRAMLEMAKIRVVVGGRLLAEEAAERGWFVV